MKKKVLVVLGAGASHGVWDSKIPSDDRWQPPLASGLFDFSKEHYLDLALKYRGAKALGSNIMQRVSAADFDLEETLRGFATASDGFAGQWFKHIPAYIRDLLERCSDHYVDVPINYTILLHELINETRHEPAFVVLNYDTLLEQALSDYWCQFNDIGDYCSQNTIGPLIKMHGSINWFVPIGEANVQWESRVAELDVIPVPNAAVHVLGITGPTERLRFGDGPQQLLYPMLTAPMAGKDPDHYVCPAEHIEALRAWGKDCRKVLIIGCSGKDSNLMALLASAIGERGGPVHYVGDRYVSEAYSRFQVVPRLRDTVRRTEKVFDGEFRRYVVSEEFKLFCRL